MNRARKKASVLFIPIVFSSEDDPLSSGLVSCYSVGCGTAGNEDLNDGVTAETVATVDASADFACCVQTRDNSAVGIENVTLGINDETAHGVVRGRSHQTDGEESIFEMIGLGDVLAVFILEELLPDGVGFEEQLANAEALSDLFKRVAELMPEAIEIGNLRLDGLSEDAIGERIGIGRKTYAYRLKKLKETIQAEFPEFF